MPIACMPIGRLCRARPYDGQGAILCRSCDRWLGCVAVGFGFGVLTWVLWVTHGPWLRWADRDFGAAGDGGSGIASPPPA